MRKTIVALNSPYQTQDEDSYALPGGAPTSLFFALSLLSDPGNIPIFNYPHYNDTIKELFVNFLQKYNPDILLVSTTTPGRAFVIEMVDTAKKFSPNVQVIVGGPDVDESLSIKGDIKRSKYGIQNSLLQADYLVSAQFAAGAYILQALIDCLESGDDIQLLSDNQNIGNGVVGSKISDTYQYHNIYGHDKNISPSVNYYQHFPVTTEFKTFDRIGTPYKTILAFSKDGCPYSCSFCSESIYTKGKTGSTDDIDIPQSIKTILSSYANSLYIEVITGLDFLFHGIEQGGEALWFEDSIVFGGDEELMKQWCEILFILRDSKELIEHYFGYNFYNTLLKIRRGCQMTFNEPEKRSNDTFQMMKATGWSYVFFGGEGFSNPMKKISKSARTEYEGKPWKNIAEETLILMKELDIIVYISTLFGLPGESKEFIDETITVLSEFRNAQLLNGISPNLVTYHVGTNLMRQDMPDINFNTIRPLQSPYNLFEEASSGIVSKHLNIAELGGTEDTIKYIIQKLIQEVGGELRGAHTPSWMEQYLLLNKE